MSSVDSALSATSEVGRDPVVVLVTARTATERRLVGSWARQHHPGARLVDHDDPALGECLQDAADPIVVPARVTWLPPDRDGRRTFTAAADLIALASPRQPPAILQRRIADRSPDRARVTVGESARALALHVDFDAETGGGGGNRAFAAFVVRRAMLACDRTERRLIGERYKVPRLVAEQITASARFRDRVAALAKRLQRPFDEVLAEASVDLEELAAVQSPPAIDAFRAAMAPLHRRAWNVDEDVETLERLRELQPEARARVPARRTARTPIRSCSPTCSHRHDFPRNHVLGGNNMAFWPIGPLGKRDGLVFIRRSFGDDEVYKLAVREYFGLPRWPSASTSSGTSRAAASRTGKLRPPRYGLLRYLVDARCERPRRRGRDPRADVDHLRPAAGGRRRWPPSRRGATKRREGIGWLVGYVRAQSRDAGTAHVRFGEPLSLRQALADAGRGQRAAREGRLRGLRRDQPRDAR